MSLTNTIARMATSIGILILVITACQKSVPAIELKNPHGGSSTDSSLYRDSTQTKDSTGTKKDSTGTKKDSTGTKKDSTGTKKDSTGTKKDTTTTKKDSTGTKKDTTTTKKDSTGTKKDTTKTTPPPTGSTTISVGTGSGSITIDGTGKTYACGTVIKIKAGKYDDITVKNVTGSNGCPVTITNDGGVVEVTGNQNTMNLSTLSYVTIVGNGTSGVSQGFSLHDNNYRALQFTGGMHNVTLQYFLFKNIGDYVISTSLGSTSYSSSNAATYWSDVHFLNMEFNNTQQINLEGDVTGGSIKGFIKNFEMAYCYMHDMSPGDLMVAGAMDKYNVHHNTVNNVNTTNNNDNGIWHIQGNGIFAYNKVTNHQGHAIRAWLVSFGSSVEQELIYNNIVVNSRKYSAFEVQSFTNFFSSGTTYANAKIFNNTCGNINLSKDPFSGVIADVYGLFGGTCNVFNNLGFNFPVPDGKDFIAQQLYTTTQTENNNLYFATSAAAGITNELTGTLSSTSPAKKAGVADPALTDDFNGTRRGNPPSIGAVE